MSLSLSPSLYVVVNVSRSQQLFTSLVSVSVQQDELISQALQERLLLAPSPHCRDKTAEGPTLLHFMTSDLFRQVPLPPMEDPVGYKLHPSTWPHHATFDLYNRHSRWEAAPWPWMYCRNWIKFHEHKMKEKNLIGEDPVSVVYNCLIDVLLITVIWSQQHKNSSMKNYY